MSRLSTWVLVALLSLSFPFSASALVVFSDDFDDGDVSDWVKSTNYAGTSTVTADASISTSPPNSLKVAFTAPPGSENPVFVNATHGWTAPVAGTYALDVQATSELCDGCIISYDIFVDGGQLAQSQHTSGFELRTFTLPGLAAGPHTVTLGMDATRSVSGDFHAHFDDLAISVPQPVTLTLIGLGAAAVGLARRRGRA
jgi:hypothetical protein